MLNKNQKIKIKINISQINAKKVHNGKINLNLLIKIDINRYLFSFKYIMILFNC